MKKSNSTHTEKSNFKLWLRRCQKKIQKTGTACWKEARPFLAAKYWPIYIIAFTAGLYLWGPGHGWQNFQTWQHRQNLKKAALPAAETLQRELNQLKLELRNAQKEPKSPAFDPASFSRPAPGQVIRGFEWLESDNSWRLHTGVDIGLPPGSNIIAAAAGTVSEIKEVSPGDYTVTINHGDGWQSMYSNLAKIMVTDGQSLIKGVIVGTSGNKGCELSVPCFHFALYHNQQAVDPQKEIAGL